MEIRYEDTEEDFLAFNIFHGSNSKSMRRNRQIGRFLFPALLVIVTLPTFVESSVVGGMILISPLVIGWIAYYPKYWRHVLNRRVRKMLREGKNVGMLGEHYLKIDQDGLTEKTSVNESKTTWQGIERIVSNDAYLFIYLSSMGAYVVPKRAFANAEEFKRFQEQAEAYRNSANT